MWTLADGRRSSLSMGRSFEASEGPFVRVWTWKALVKVVKLSARPEPLESVFLSL
jgi:hypothetical protein